MSDHTKRTASDAALVELLVEVTRAFFRLRAAGRDVGAVDSSGAGRWGFLRSLAVEGPQTVPQLARARPVARQYVQTMANALVAEGLIEFFDNPAHRRSRLMRLTKKGERHFAGIDSKVRAVAREIGRGLNTDEVDSARRVLSRLAI